MYREAGPRAVTPPTKIVYGNRNVRIGVVIGALAALVGALLMLSRIHIVHVSCTRGEADIVRSGQCTAYRYSLLPGNEAEVPLDQMRALKVEIGIGSKGGRYGVVSFERKDDLAITISGHDSMSGVDIPLAREAASDFQRFLASTQTSFSVWLRPSLFALFVAGGFGAVLLFVSSKLTRQQIEQVRPITIVVDHDARTVVIGGKTIAWNDIEDIAIASGSAFDWAAKKGETIIGHKLRVLTKNGDYGEATPTFRAGDIAEHERVRRDLARTIGFELEE